MSSQLDPEILAAITAEARQCFLDEDAPEYVQMLERGVQDRANPDFNQLLRAAHSLKGGAGLASLSSLQHLAHKLEDVMLGIKEGQIAEQELAWALIEKGIDEVGYVVGQARTVDNAIANPELIVALESLASTVVQTESDFTDEGDRSEGNNDLIRNALTVELEASFVAIEELELDTPEEVLQPILSGFADECMFLAETLELPWLQSATAPIAEVLTESDLVEALLLTQEIIAQLRTEIQNYLSNLVASQESSAKTEGELELVAATLNEDLETLCQAMMELTFDTPEELIQEALTGFADESTFLGETLELSTLR